MKKSMTESKSTKTTPPQQKRDNVGPLQASASAPTHSDITERAYEIYHKDGRKHGQAEKHWHQAEQELRNKKVE